jgi:hypothetical protein
MRLGVPLFADFNGAALGWAELPGYFTEGGYHR